MEQQRFMARMQSCFQQVLQFHDPTLKAQALKLIPDHIRSSAKVNYEDQVIKELLHWFKHDFFKWVNAPPCSFCQCATKCIGMDRPTPVEQSYHAGNVEVYACETCGTITRFPRYNHVGKLLETRCGRCGEWAQAFTLCCTAMGYEARYVMDWTDHVWTEVYSPTQKRWIHCDACECAFDAPMIYEAGWGKKLSYIIAFSGEEVVDTTKRYTKNWTEVLSRRTLVSEAWLAQVIFQLNQLRQAFMPRDRVQAILMRQAAEYAEMEKHIAGAGPTTELKPEELQSRISGSQEWKEARGETGNKATCAQTCSTASGSEKTLIPFAEAEDKMVTVFDYPHFDTTATSQWALTGDAVHVSDRIRLTRAASSQHGAAWYVQPVNVSNDFSVRFSFQVNERGGADGFAFVIQNQGLGALGGQGCDLGYAGIRNSLAVEFDTYQTHDRCEDPNDNHISVQTRGAEPNSAHHRFSLGCAASNFPQMADGRVHTAKITYCAKTLLVFMDNLSQPILEVPVDLSSRLSLQENGTAFVGFTAATGGLFASHDILSCSLKASHGATLSLKYMPQTTYTTWDTLNQEGVMKKLKSFNSELRASQDNQHLALSEADLQCLESAISAKDKDTRAATDALDLLVKSIRSLPRKYLFPLIDVLKFLIMFPPTVDYFTSTDEAVERTAFLRELITTAMKDAAPYENKLVQLRLLANMFHSATLRGFIEKHQTEIFDAIIDDCIESDKMFLRQAFCAVLCNFAVLYRTQPNEEGRIQAVSALTRILSEETQDKVIYCAVVALGTLIYGDAETSMLASTLDVIPSLERIASLADLTPETKQSVQELRELLIAQQQQQQQD